MPNAAITLVSHASVIIEVEGVRILTDPWLTGTAFNDSWRLLIEPMDLAPELDTIDYLWISHEHPDHFHIPSLRAFPPSFRERVQVLFQASSDAPKMISALEGPLGFRKITLLPHRAFHPLRNGVEVYTYQSRQIDSALGVRGGGTTILNLNDVEASKRDLALIRTDLGPIDALLNQFSIAGFSGIETTLAPLSASILDNMVRDHRALGAKATVPFASFAYFCCEDNRMVNRHANSPMQASERYIREGLPLVVLAPGDRWDVGSAHDNVRALAYYAKRYEAVDTLDYRRADPVEPATIFDAFHAQRVRLRAMHGTLPLKLLRPFTVHVPDLDRTFTFGFANGGAREMPNASPDLTIFSQPLHFLFAQPFGLQTLGVSGRYRLHAGKRNWLLHRILLAAMNAGIGLAPSRLFSRAQLAWLWSRRDGFVEQIDTRLRRAFAS